MRSIDLIAFFTIAFLLARIVLLVKIDKVKNKNTIFKFLFGAYAIEAMLPIIRRANTKEESALIRLANICLVLFYVLFVTLMLVIWFTYKD